MLIPFKKKPVYSGTKVRRATGIFLSYRIILYVRIVNYHTNEQRLCELTICIFLKQALISFYFLSLYPLDMKKTLYILFGSISLILGVIGVFVPGLPTTPFVLLASWLFYRSSEKLHAKLLNSPMGGYINRYKKRGGMGRTTKIAALCTMWIMINISAFVVFEALSMRIFLYVLGILGTVCVVFIVPSAKKDITE